MQRMWKESRGSRTMKKFIKRLLCFHNYGKYYGYTQICIKCHKITDLRLETLLK